MAPNNYCLNSEQTAPINITNQNVNECQSSCNYSPKYDNTTFKYTNYGDYIGIKLDNNNNAIQFNNASYKVQEIRIYSGSLHTYFNKSEQGEMLIIHTNNNIAANSNLLIVSIPITTSNTSTLASLDLESIIQYAAANAPLSSLSTSNSTGSIRQSGTYTNNTINLNLDKFVPKTSYYYYQGVFGFQKNLSACNNPSNIIVYSPNIANISISTEKMTLLGTLLDNGDAQYYNTINKNLTPILYFNSAGVNSVKEDDIYIDCQPVNQSTGEIYVPVDKPSLDYSNMLSDMGDNISGPLLSALIGVLLIVGIYSMSKILLDRLSSNKS